MATRAVAPERSATRVSRRALRRDLKIVLRLRHTNLVSAVAFDSRARVVRYEDVTGVSLDRVLQDCSPLGLAAAMVVYDDCLAGLEALHSAGVHHGALSPDTLLVETTGVVLLRDACILEPTAPTASVASDLYAAALVFYETLAGRTPRTRATEPARRASRAWIRAAMAAVPVGARLLLRQGLDPDESTRLPSARACRHDLAAAAGSFLGPEWRRAGRVRLAEVATAQVADPKPVPKQPRGGAGRKQVARLPVRQAAAAPSPAAPPAAVLAAAPPRRSAAATVTSRRATAPRDTALALIAAARERGTSFLSRRGRRPAAGWRLIAAALAASTAMAAGFLLVHAGTGAPRTSSSHRALAVSAVVFGASPTSTGSVSAVTAPPTASPPTPTVPSWFSPGSTSLGEDRPPTFAAPRPSAAAPGPTPTSNGTPPASGGPTPTVAATDTPTPSDTPTPTPSDTPTPSPTDTPSPTPTDTPTPTPTPLPSPT